jgi:hypothetical protein
MPRQALNRARNSGTVTDRPQVCRVPPLLRELAFAVATLIPQGNLGGFCMFCPL